MTVLTFEEWRALHPEDFGTVACPDCDGDGWSGDGRGFVLNKCRRCRGHGELTGKRAARAVYDAERKREAELLSRFQPPE